LADRRESNRAGLNAEKAVEAFLRGQGWTILAHRWIGAGAEVDLIVVKNRMLRFVEVKYRQKHDPVGLECVDGRKLKRIERASEVFLQGFQDFDEACIAVAYVTPSPTGWHIEFLDDPS